MCVHLIHTFWYINMPDKAASYETSLDFFANFYTLLLTTMHSDVSYLHTNIYRLCVSSIHTFYILACQIWLQVIERHWYLLCFFWVFPYIIDDKKVLHQKCINYMFFGYKYFDITTSKMLLEVEKPLILLVFWTFYI